MRKPPSQKLTVVLDLDHTLIYARHTKIKHDVDESLRTHFIPTQSALNSDGIFVIERPGLLTFLRELNTFCQVMLFTASLQEYALPILGAIDPDGIFFSKAFFREDTTTNIFYRFVKDLTLVGRPLERVVILDDEPGAYSMQPHNGIFAPKFWGNPSDDLLLSCVLPLIRKLSALEDVRDYLMWC